MTNQNFKTVRYIPEHSMGTRKFRTRTRMVATHIPNRTQIKRALAQSTVS